MDTAQFMKWFVVFWLLLGSLATVYMVGKPREPLAAGTAIFNLIINGLIVVAIVALWET
ncbi:MAG: hypothetical protein M3N52_11950 [Actinomycetota bacterium]|nr:hypothetical protein [Actinomycetota bacterium]